MALADAGRINLCASTVYRKTLKNTGTCSYSAGSWDSHCRCTKMCCKPASYN